MLQSRALVIALILLLSTTLPEVQSKSIFERDRRDLLAIPETIASYFYEAVNKVSPKVSQFLLDTVQSPTVIAARYGKLLCTNIPTAMCEKGEGAVGERID
uniref:Apovitellenin-1 n=1 Tax=Cyanistes caeruleus TaxID=156563 RepID=A0A8C0V543_CYACU